MVGAGVEATRVVNRGSRLGIRCTVGCSAKVLALSGFEPVSRGSSTDELRVSQRSLVDGGFVCQADGPWEDAMSPSRRDLLKFALLGGAAAALPVGRATASLSERLLQQAVDSPPVPSFAVPLRIPPVLTPTRATATTDFYDITQQIATVQILPGLGPTAMWTYNGLVPGPTIIQRQGRDVRVRQHNALQVPVSTHLHGGGPQRGRQQRARGDV